MNATATAAAPIPAVVPALALGEGMRLLRHPVMVLGFGLFALATSFGATADDGPRQAFSTVDSALSFFPGVMAILAANLVASRDLRAGSRDMLAPAPTRLQERVLALCVGSMVPALASLAAVLVVHAVHLQLDRYAVEPSMIYIVQGPVAVFGACVLGIMIATWLPQRGVIAISLVLVVTGNVWLAGDGTSDRQLFGMAMSWPAWVGDGSRWGGLLPGDVRWHVLYLLGLCGLAIAATLVRVAERRTPAVGCGVLMLGVVIVAGIGQLP
jgi:hypothetical protein